MDAFELNAKIDITTEDDEMVKGLLLDVEGPKIYISIIQGQNGFKFLREGDKLSAIVYGKKEIISFDAIVTARVIREHSAYELSHIKNIAKTQRRQFVRVSYSNQVYFINNRYLDNISIAKDHHRISRKIRKNGSHGVMIDISGGGLRFSCNKDLSTGDELLLSFNLHQDNFVMKCKVTYKKLSVSTSKTTYIYGVEFEDISEAMQEKIIRNIFLLMRKYRLQDNEG